MDEQASGLQIEEPRLSSEQKAEIGDILISARTVSRQMIHQARIQSDEILQLARDRAEQITQAAEEKAADTLRAAEEEADAILRAAMERAAAVERAASGEEPAIDSGEAPAVMPAQLQDYVVRCVGDCFAKLRRQQLDAAEAVNEQWRAFLSGLPMSEEPTVPALPLETEINREDIENRVSNIARELMEIIKK